MSDGLPTECTVAALRGLVRQLGQRERMVCAQVAVQALQDPEVRQKLEGAGQRVVGNAPDEFAALIRAERRKWSELAAAAGIKADE